MTLGFRVLGFRVDLRFRVGVWGLGFGYRFARVYRRGLGARLKYAGC